MKTFQGHPLPPLRPGKVWSLQVYPGGRKIVRQCDPSQLVSVAAAVDELNKWNMVHIALDDAVALLKQWQYPQRQTHTTDDRQSKPL